MAREHILSVTALPPFSTELARETGGLARWEAFLMHSHNGHDIMGA
jgi:hypothetical protein